MAQNDMERSETALDRDNCTVHKTPMRDGQTCHFCRVAAENRLHRREAIRRKEAQAMESLTIGEILLLIFLFLGIGAILLAGVNFQNRQIDAQLSRTNEESKR